MKFSDLNDEQKAAVKCQDNLLLTACPGSGKTRVITHKVAWEIDNLSSPKQKVIALTFTIRAAEEIERRLEKENVDPSRFWIGNIHAFCLNWILRQYSSFYEKTKKGFTVIDSVKSDEILGDICDRLGFDKKKVLWNLERRIKPDGTFLELKPDMLQILKEYATHLEQNRFVDFDRLLFYSFDLLCKYPKIGTTLSSIIPVILVDEYQDTQELQYQIIFQIFRQGKGKTRVCFVGDPDQAIYGSLGGVAKTKSELEQGLGCEILQDSLPGNYRSTQRVIDFYRNFQNQDLKIVARGEYANEPGYIALNDAIHRDELVDRLKYLIEGYLEKGIKENEICVLVPQWYLVMGIAGQLRQAMPEIPIDATGVGPMSANRDNFFYKLTRILMTEPSPRVYSLRIKWAKELIGELIHYYADPSLQENISPRDFLKTCNNIHSEESDLVDYLNHCFKQFFEGFGLGANPGIETNLSSYISGINKRIKDDGYALSSDVETFRNFFKEARGVVISSCHGVKGEEFEVVIAFGLVFGHLPHWGAFYSKEIDHDDTAKKLLYVICSRAKRYLHLISERGRGKKDEDLETTHQLAEITFDYDDLL